MSGRSCVARIASVDPGSPAALAGFEPGDAITAVDGHPVRDILDWQWLTADEECKVTYLSVQGDAGEVLLTREDWEPWGISFEGVLFDGVRTCKNACTFCFMRQLPKGLRKPLYVRDDDVRLSFLQGNFVTLTNMDDEDIARIAEQRISPLRVSLHAVDASVRRVLMGKNAAVGLRNLEALLDAGIEVDAQVVLVPGVNDGQVLDDTLAWAYAQPNIKTMGIVPLGYTKHQDVFSKSFDDPSDALRVLDQLKPIQQRALADRGFAWAFAADEFYLNAYGTDVLQHLPDASFYGDFSMFEDGIGIVRSSVDDFLSAQEAGRLEALVASMEGQGLHAVMVCGCAMQPYLPQLITGSPLKPHLESLFVKNEFFGGNVDVTGLLAGEDMAQAVAAHASADALFLLPAVAFNADGLTVDGLTVQDIQRVSGRDCVVAPSNPLDCIEYLMDIV